MTILIVPDTVVPFAGDVIAITAPGVGVGVGTPAVGVGVATPLATVTVTEALARRPLELKPLARIVWLPSGTVVEFQLKVYGGDEAK